MNARPALSLQRLFLILVLLLAQVVAGDIVVRNDGTMLEGVIVEENDQFVKLQIDRMHLTIPREQVEKIETSGYQLDPLAVSHESRRERVTKLKAQDSLSRGEVIELRNNLLAWDKMIDEELSAASDLEKMLETIRVTRQKKPGPEADRHLARCLMLLSKEYFDRAEHTMAEQALEEAYRVCPDSAGLAKTLTGVYAKSPLVENRRKMNAILRPYLELYPDDIEAVALYAPIAWESDPFFVLDLLYPGGATDTRFPNKTQSLIPKALLKAFGSGHAKETQGWDRITLFEHYLRFEPDTNPSPLCELQIAAGYDPATVCMRYFAWAWENEKFISSLLAIDAAAFKTADEEKKEKLSKDRNLRMDQVKRAYVQLAKNQIEKKQFGAAHQKLLEAVYYFPEVETAYELLRNQTGIKDCCGECGGSGRLRCRTCSGEGVLQFSKTVYCGTCGGDGEIYSPPPSRMQIEAAMDYSMAAGAVVKIPAGGYRECPDCDGRGKETSRWKETCHTCDGTGIVNCRPCGATGIVSLRTPRSLELVIARVDVAPEWLLRISRPSAFQAKMLDLYKKHTTPMAVANPIFLDIPGYPQEIQVAYQPSNSSYFDTSGNGVWNFGFGGTYQPGRQAAPDDDYSSEEVLVAADPVVQEYLAKIEAVLSEAERRNTLAAHDLKIANAASNLGDAYEERGRYGEAAEKSGLALEAAQSALDNATMAGEYILQRDKLAFDLGGYCQGKGYMATAMTCYLVVAESQGGTVLGRMALQKLSHLR